jgi:hypothetical protein
MRNAPNKAAEEDLSMEETNGAGARRSSDKERVAPAVNKPPSRESETTGPREVIKQAARDIHRGLLDTDLHGVPANVPGPHRDPERSEGAVVPPEGVDRTAPGKRSDRKRGSDKGKQ